MEPGLFPAAILGDVKNSALLAAALASLLTGVACSKADIDNKDAVRAAMIEYLEKNKASTGLDPSAMDINVDAVQFERDTARATVSFLIKGTDQGMQGNYTLTRDGNKWGKVTRQNMTAAPHGGAVNEPPPPVEKGAKQQGASQQGASQQGKEALLPVPLPGTQQQLPAGHPPVSGQAK